MDKVRVRPCRPGSFARAFLGTAVSGCHGRGQVHGHVEGARTRLRAEARALLNILPVRPSAAQRTCPGSDSHSQILAANSRLLPAAKGGIQEACRSLSVSKRPVWRSVAAIDLRGYMALLAVRTRFAMNAARSTCCAHPDVSISWEVNRILRDDGRSRPCDVFYGFEFTLAYRTRLDETATCGVDDGRRDSDTHEWRRPEPLVHTIQPAAIGEVTALKTWFHP
jgi:hypothetical protein